MEANLRFSLDEPEIIKKSIEADQEDSGSITVNFKAKDDLEVGVVADGISNLRAGVNTIFRLVKTAEKATRR